MNVRDSSQSMAPQGRRPNPPRFLFAGDRAISVSALKMVARHGDVPAVLCVSDRKSASHAGDLISCFHEVGGEPVIRGSQLRDRATIEWLRGLELEFALSVHFPHIVPPDVLAAPERGWLNVHPAYLPHNRGWHTPTWALLNGTPTGATIHVMTESVDAGPILAQKRIMPHPDETAHELYQRLLEAELALLETNWAHITSEKWELANNPIQEGSFHSRADLNTTGIRRLDLDEQVVTGELINRLRALTTNDPSEAAYFERDGKRYLVRIEILHAE